MQGRTQNKTLLSKVKHLSVLRLSPQERESCCRRGVKGKGEKDGREGGMEGGERGSGSAKLLINFSHAC